MCGIGGFVDFDRDARRGGPVLSAMDRRLRPRGPDASGTYTDPDAALVHRRLIVIDPEGGAQPMLSPDGNTVLVYNGELYNTDEVRDSLAALGHVFRSRSDTEVVLHAFLEWDTDAFARLDGIFAFALWQKAERRLVLVRDRLGVKPLFCCPTRSGLVFGSTIDTVLCHPEAEPVLDEDGLRTVLLLGPARPPESGVFRGISSLLPGSFAVLTPEGFRRTAYWRLEAHEHEDDLDATVQRTHDLITDAAQRQLVSDVPLACFLSGGLDSSILSAVAARAYAARNETLHTWSVDYRENQRYFVKNSFQPTDDRDFAALMTDFLGTHHHRVVLDPEAVCAALRPAAEARGLPGMADVDSSLLLFCAAVKQGGYDCGIAFDGDADRCLACDENGAEIDGDKIIALVGTDMKERGRLDGNTVVVTVMSNLGFMKYMQSLGIETARTAVGDRYVLEEMRARGYAIGGEQSGHVIFLHHSTTGDGELTAGKLLKLLARKHREEGTKMSELNAVYTKFPQVLINLTADKEQKQAYKEDEYIAGFIESQQQNLMGMGRVLVRVSGTEPKIRVMVEGEDMEAIQSSAERIADMIRQRIPGVC